MSEKTFLNSHGKIFYGMHFYPGVAEYSEKGKEPFRVFLNEDTLRAMDPTFQGRPIFVEHVDDVEDDINELRKESDGWVIESFFNAADGKHWVKFIVVSDKAERAIKNGFRLSNAYIPKSFGEGGLWNGVTYQRQILNGEFEHLAIVQNPRYEESVIMTPEEFKLYNEQNMAELKKIANSKDTKRETEMKFNIFKRAKVENDLSDLMVVLPKSGKEKSITQLVNEADEMEEKKKMGNEGLADPSHKVKLHDGSYCNVAELVEKHKAMHDELAAMKDAKEKEGELEMKEESVEVEGDDKAKNEDMDGEKAENEDDESAKKKALELAEHEEKEIEAAKKKNAKEKAEKLKNAHLKVAEPKTRTIELSTDLVARGKARYGSSK